MIEKYRVHELAKDLNVPTKDIVAMLEANFPGEPKKHMTVLTDDELNYVFESYTQKNESKNLDEYFALKNQKKELPKEKKDEHGKKEEPVRQAKPAREEKPAVSDTVTEKPAVSDTVTEKPEKTEKTERTEKAAPVSSQPVSEQLTEKKQQSAPAASTRPVDPAVANFKPGQRTYNRPNERGGAGSPRNMQQGTRPADRTGSAPTGGQRPYGNNNQQGGRFGDRSGGAAAGTQRSYNNNQQNGRFGDRAGTPAGSQRPYGNNQQGGRFNDRSNDRFGGNRTQGGQRPQQNAAPAKPAAPAAPVIPNDGTPIEIKVRQPKAKLPKGERVQQGTTVTNVIVDMRSSEVDLDKYNERYEQIAPASSSKDTMLKKQKLNQKSAQRKGKPFMSRKEKEDQKLHRLQLERERREKLEVALPEEISVGDLAALLKVQASEIIKRLMPLGIMASISQVIDYDTAALVSMEIGAKVTKEVVVTIEDRLFDESEDSEENLIERSPVVVVMGHVDHGKTSLLDAIRNTSVVSGEAGGITQHIGAYQVELNGRTITFLDTPGHAAFTSMRARGAQITDIAVLVVAADDGIMPQTIEAINHAKAAGVTAIVAINKMDKPHANPDRVMQQLTEHNLLPEAWGGDTICVPVSAKTRMGIDDLLENILLVADIKELKANPDRLARGTVVEAKLDKGRGPVATVLVQNGTLHTGDVIIAGTSVGRVRNMTDDKGNKVQSAGPSQPVEITGLAEVPAAGDQFNAVEDERLARELVEKRRMEAKEEQFKSYQKVTLDNLFEHISEGEMKELPIIVKADVQGSVEAVKQSLEKLSNDEVRVSVIHAAVGSVKESDVMLANASGAIIIGFNVRPDPTAKENAERDGVDIRLYRIIYDAIEEVEAAIKGMLTPKTKEVDIGRAEVRQVYTITNVGKVAGCYVLSGKICRGVNIRLVRDGIILTDVKLASLKRFKDDVREVASGYECGITLEKYADIKEGDIFEAYEIQQVTE